MLSCILGICPFQQAPREENPFGGGALKRGRWAHGIEAPKAPNRDAKGVEGARNGEGVSYSLTD